MADPRAIVEPAEDGHQLDTIDTSITFASNSRDVSVFTSYENFRVPHLMKPTGQVIGLFSPSLFCFWLLRPFRLSIGSP